MHIDLLFTSKSYQLKDVCKVMCKPRRYVISVLKRNRYYGKQGQYSRITTGMLDVLADDYVNTLHNFFNQAQNGEVKNKEKLKYFHSLSKQFKRDSCIEYAHSWEEIDEDLIRRSFIHQIEKNAPVCEDRLWNSISKTVSKAISESDLEPFLAKTAMDFGLLYAIREDNQSSLSQFRQSFYEYEQKLTDSILIGCITGTTDCRYASTNTSSQSTASPSIFVRPHIRPHLYRLFGSSRDDSHLPQAC